MEYVSDNISIYGYTPDDFLSGNIKFASIVHPEDLLHVGEEVAQYTREGRSEFTQEYRIFTKSGEVRWIDDMTWIRRDANGKATHYQGIIVDITERKEVEELLRKSEANYRGVIENIQDAFYRSDAAGNLIMASPSLLRIIRYDSLEECYGKPIAETFYYEPEKRKELIKKIIQDKSVTDYEVVLKKKDGTPVVVETNSHIYYDENGAIVGIEGMLRDITMRKQAEEYQKNLEEQLIHAQKIEALGNLAGGIAHDFNNILGGIIGYAELSIKEAQEQPKLLSYLKQLLIASNRAKDLVGHIMAFSRKTEHEKLPVRVSAIVREVVKLMRASLPSTIEICPRINEDGQDTIMADATQIHQVFINLCTNAGYAMKDTGGVLEISLKETYINDSDLGYFPFLKEGHYLILTVADSGCGIAKDNIGKIFDPYFTTKEGGEGTGLGLSLVHGIIREHHGDIKVYSELGKGTVFTIYLPLIEREAERQDEAQGELRGGKERILYIDDESILVDLGKEMLESLGYTVMGETDPLTALEIFKNNIDYFDLVITDKTMPSLTGFDLARELLTIRPELPIIVCTGYQGNEDLEKIEEMGINSYIKKPVGIEELSKAVRAALDEEPPKRK